MGKYKDILSETFEKFESKVEKILKLEKEKGKDGENEAEIAFDKKNGSIGKAKEDFDNAYDVWKKDMFNVENRVLNAKNGLRLSIVKQRNELGFFYCQFANPEYFKNCTAKAKVLKKAIEGFTSTSKNKQKLVNNLYVDFIQDIVDRVVAVSKGKSGRYLLKGDWCRTKKKDMQQAGGPLAPNKIKSPDGKKILVLNFLDEFPCFDKATAFIALGNYRILTIDENKRVICMMEYDYAKDNPQDNPKGIKCENNERLITPEGVAITNPKKFRVSSGGLY